jgi:hypothetical protein
VSYFGFIDERITSIVRTLMKARRSRIAEKKIAVNKFTSVGRNYVKGGEVNSHFMEKLL